jgi:alpha-glucosidase
MESTVHRSSDIAGGKNAATGSGTEPWWRNAVVYRVDLASFSDGNADGIGDLAGLRSRLGYLPLLGATVLSVHGALHGPTGLQPTAGALTDLDALLADAHELGVRVQLALPDVGPDDTVESAARFWLDRGVDGFRIDEPAPDHEPIERLRRVLDAYPNRALTGAAGRLLIRSGLADAAWDASALIAAVSDVPTADDSAEVGWLLSDPASRRPASRWGGGSVGDLRARAVAVLQLALPGTPEIWAGDELGLPDAALPADAPTPPPNSSRVALPWSGEKPPYEFTSLDECWPPMPEDWVDLTVENQLDDSNSTLSLYRRMLELRRTHPAISGDTLEWYGAPAGCFAFRRSGGLVCALNTTDDAVLLPPGEPLLSSMPLIDGALPGNSAAWLG